MLTLSGRGDKDVAQVQAILEARGMNSFDQLRVKRDAGSKLLVMYVTAGVRDDWLDIVATVAQAGADAIEIGVPFSDPVMDGPVIQAASQLALQRGMTPEKSLKELSPGRHSSSAGRNDVLQHRSSLRFGRIRRGNVVVWRLRSDFARPSNGRMRAVARRRRRQQHCQHHARRSDNS